MKAEREAFEESNNIKPDWSFKFDNELQQYVELDHEMQAQVEEFNEHWDTFRAGWQAAKAQAIPEGYVLMPKEPSADLVNHGHQVFLGHFNEGGQTGGRSLYFAYKAMIAAQGPAND